LEGFNPATGDECWRLLSIARKKPKPLLGATALAFLGALKSDTLEWKKGLQPVGSEGTVWGDFL